MNQDDIIYSLSLIFCILFGYIYRNINNKEFKKWTGTILGLFLIIVLGGYHILHLFIVCIGNIFILYSNKKKCHLLSFLFSFTYLLFFRTTVRFGIPYPPAHMNVIQMMFTLKMVGLALDLKNNTLAMEEYEYKNDDQKAEITYNCFNLTVADIFHYSLNYIGIVTGPYFRYRTFLDYMDLPFSKYGNCEKHTLKKLKIFPLIAVIFLFLSYYWPISYCTTDEFYQDCTWLYRFWYMWVIFYFYRMRIYCGLILTECICIMAGLGAYPEITRPRSGRGPTENFEKIGQIAKDTSLLSKTEFNFETINNIDPMEVDFCITVRLAMKHWNTCIQYWLAVNVYRCFPYKKFRTFATLFVSAYWHGLYLGHYVCIWSVAFYLPVEDLYVNLYLKNNSGPYLKFWKWFIWYMKMQTFGYLCIAMQLLTYENVMRYYNSVNHFWIVALIILYLIGLTIKFKRRVQIN